MKNYKVILFYLFLLFAVGCGSTKKKVEKIETSVSDTLIMKTKVIEQPPILSSLTINEICDSITNKPVQFKKEFVIDKDTVYVEITDNELKISYELAQKRLKEMDSIIAYRDTEYSEVKETETTKVVWSKLTWIFLGLAIGFCVFPFVPKWINAIARKLIIGG